MEEISEMKLVLGFSNADFALALRDGRVKPEGIELEYVASAAGDIFRRMRKSEEFDVSEMSISNYVSDISNNITRFIAIPVFTRMFRHSYVYINKRSGINKPTATPFLS